MIWNPQMECASKKDKKTLQLERLKWSVGYSYDNVASVRAKMDAVGVTPKHIKSLKDIALLPFTVKDEMRQAFPYGLFAVPMQKIVRLHASSGTTGKATVVGYTKNDLEMWSEVCARFICAAGVTDQDIAQISFGYGLFTGAFGLHYGLEKVGATVIPVSGGNTERQIQIMQDFGATALICTPSYALYMSEVAHKTGAIKNIKLRYGLFGGEGSSESMRGEIEKRWGIQATDNYGLSEIIGPGVSGECLEKCGLHVAEDHFYCEVIDPDTGEVLPMGQKGELVITTLTREGIPMLRYRTRDITRLIEEPCKCGRTSLRMEKVQGRSDDMLIIRGVNVFPSQIEEVLVATEGLGPHYEIIVRREGFLDTMEVKVELADTAMVDDFAMLEQLSHHVRNRIKSVCLVDAKITLSEPFTLRRSEGKAKRVEDLRNNT